MKQDGGWRRAAWSALALALGLSSASLAEAQAQPLALCTVSGGTYTRHADVCGDGSNAARCDAGDTSVSLTIDDGAWRCGPNGNKYPSTVVTRTCKRPDRQVQCPKRDAQLKDFDSDGISDILWHQPNTGEVSFWWGGATPGSRDGTGVLNWTARESDGWKVVGSGHFNADNDLDILWHNGSTGQLSAWFLDGTQIVVSNGFVNATMPESRGWKVVGTGDFNRDGKSDVLWHHTDGTLSVWYLDGMTVLGTGNLSWNAKESDGWKVRGTGDFDGDGNIDVLWHQASSGKVGAWFLSGLTVQRDGFFSWNSPGSNGWELMGTGDHDHDGKLDLLWYYPSQGIVSAWTLDGLTVKGRLDYSMRAPAIWKIVSR